MYVDPALRAPDRRVGLSGEVFMWSTLAAAALYFYLDDSALAPYVPAMVPAAVLLQAAWLTLRGNRVDLNPFGVQLLVTYGVVCILSLLFSSTVDFYAIRKVLLPAAAFTIPVFRYQVAVTRVQQFFYGLLLLGLLVAVTRAGDLGTVSMSLLSTTSATESIFSLALGAGAVWMVANQRHGLAFVLFLGCILLFKRNAILAAALCTSIFFVISVLVRPKLRPLVATLTAATIAIAFSITSFYLNDIFSFISTLLSGVTAEFASTGRSNVYRAILYDISNNSTLEWLVGHGAGSVERMIASVTYINRVITLPHNEYFSIIYDFGLVGLFLVLAALLRLASAGTGSALVVTYVFVVSIIENLLFISFVLMTILFLASAVAAPRGPAVAAQPAERRRDSPATSSW